MLARMQDNQLFAACSFVVGATSSRGEQPGACRQIGCSPPVTPRRNGVLVEMGGPHSEGVVVAEWDFAARSKQLWESSDTPVRRTLSTTQIGNVLGQIYARLQSLPLVAEPRLLEASDVNAADAASETVLALDDLTVLASITSRWPPGVASTPEAGNAVSAGPVELGADEADLEPLDRDVVNSLAPQRAAPDHALHGRSTRKAKPTKWIRFSVI